MALNTVSSDRLSTNVKNTNFTAAEKQDLTDDILPLATQFGQSKNLIINGAMNVAQRGTSSTSDGYHTCDRWKLNFGTVDEAPTQAQVDVQSSATPYTLGLKKCFKVTNGNQTSGAQAGTVLRFRYCIEAQDIANSGWNYTSSSSYITISFWCRSSVAQNFFCDLQTSDGTAQNFAYQTGSLSADTWTKITKTIPGGSNVAFDSDNGHGLFFNVNPFMGTNFSDAGHTLDAWSTFDSANRYPNNTTTWYTTNDSTFELTGVQIEVGSVATDFEHRSFSDELRRCQRYFEKTSMYLSTNGYPFIYQTEKRAAATVTTPDAGGTFHLAGVTPSTTSMWVRRTGGGGQYTVHMDAEL
jgi:hypothetical protein